MRPRFSSLTSDLKEKEELTEDMKEQNQTKNRLHEEVEELKSREDELKTEVETSKGHLDSLLKRIEEFGVYLETRQNANVRIIFRVHSRSKFAIFLTLQ